MPAFGPAAYDWTLRPLGDTALQRILDRATPEPVDTVATVCWGAESTFGDPGGGFRVPPDVIVRWPDPEEEEDDESTEEWTEVDREETDPIRVENPDDPDQYVMVVDVLKIRFERPDGTRVRLTFNPPSQE